MDEIKVCPRCSSPLIFTFMFSGSEWYCRECHDSFPMFNVDRFISTPELLAKGKADEEWFEGIAKDCIPRGSRLKGCEKCAGEYHHDHATDEEKSLSDKAYSILFGR